MKNFDERFWVTMAILGMAFTYDVLISVVSTKLDSHLVDVLLTFLNGGGFVVAVQYWLGGSKGSTEKDATINTMAQKVGP